MLKSIAETPIIKPAKTAAYSLNRMNPMTSSLKKVMALNQLYTSRNGQKEIFAHRVSTLYIINNPC